MTRSFEVPGKIAGKGRPRFGNNRTFTPGATVNAEQWVRLCAQQAGVEMLDGPVALDVIALRAIPESWSKRKRAAAVEEAWASGRPDLDNVAKLVGDALNGIAWRDDAQVVRLHCERRWAADGRERLLVLIRPAREAI